jgi:hypothetical protein
VKKSEKTGQTLVECVNMAHMSQPMAVRRLKNALKRSISDSDANGE